LKCVRVPRTVLKNEDVEKKFKENPCLLSLGAREKERGLLLKLNPSPWEITCPKKAPLC